MFCWQCLAQLSLAELCTLQLYIEPELRTNRPKNKLLQSEPPKERFYEPEGVGIMCKKGDEVRNISNLFLLVSFILCYYHFLYVREIEKMNLHVHHPWYSL